MQERDIDSLVSVNSKLLHVRLIEKQANRSTIVFLHDSLGCIQLWRDWPLMLAEETKCNVLIYDRLGYGKSAPMPTTDRPTNYLELEADVLFHLLVKLELNDTILFGHSDGGSIALIHASKYPEKVRAVVSEAAHIFVEDVTIKGIEDAKQAYRSTDLSTRLKKYHGDKVDTLFNAWTQTWTRGDYRDWNIENFLPGIICPMLVIQGEADEFGTLDQVKRIMSQVSGKAEEFVIPHVGHTPHKEDAEKVLARVKDFINGLS